MGFCSPDCFVDRSGANPLGRDPDNGAPGGSLERFPEKFRRPVRSPPVAFQQEPDDGGGTPVFLGEDLLAYLVLALGAALFIGNVLAVVRPPERPKDGELERAPVARSVFMAVLGLLAAVWALASLVSGD